MLGVIASAHEVKRDVRIAADDPTVVAGGDVEEVSGVHLDDAAVPHGRHGFSLDDQAHMFDHAIFVPT